MPESPTAAHSMSPTAGMESVEQPTVDRTPIPVQSPGPVSRYGRLRAAVILGDVVAVLVALQLAIWAAGIVRDNAAQNAWARMNAVGLILMSVVAIAAFGLYRRRPRLSGHMEAEAPRLLMALTFFGFMLMLVMHGLGAEDAILFDGEVFAWWLFSFPLILMMRALVRAEVSPKVVGRQRTLIVGAGRIGQTIARKLQQQGDGDVEVVGFVDNDPIPIADDLADIPLVGGEEDIIELVRGHNVQRLVISFSRTSPEQLVEIMRWSDLHHIHITIVPRYFDVLTTNIDIDAVTGIPVLDLRPARLSRSARAVKRATDLTVTILLIPFLVPLFLAIAAAIKISTRGKSKVFFRQERSGRNGEVFKIVKFCTMEPDAELRRHTLQDQNEMSGPLFKIKDDPRVTGIGKFLRKTSLDEFPQFINVLRGEMSLVGPRPFVTHEDDLITGWARRRLELTPGITGLWQTMGRNDLPFEEMVKLDHMYVTRWSLAWDLKILLQTIPTVLKRRGAY